MSWYTLRPRAGAAALAAQAAAGLAVAAAQPREAELWIYADIGESWADQTVSARALVQELEALDVDALHVRINSYGGSVSDGIAIHNALRRSKAQIHTHIDGIAASIASLIAMAGTVRTAAPNARLMIHAPWSIAMGSATHMRTSAEMLDGWAQSMAADYARATGKTEAEVSAWLTDDADHWFSAKAALAEGLITAIEEPATEEPGDPAASAAASKPQSSAMPWAHTSARWPGAITPTPSTPATLPPAAAAATTQESTMTTQTTAAAQQDQAVTQANAQAAIAQAVAAESSRQAQIRAAAKAIAGRFEGVEELAEKAAADTGMTVQAFKAAALDLQARNVEPAAAGYITVTHDEADKQKLAQAKALAARAGLETDDSANPWRGRTMLQMAENSLLRAGLRESSLPGNKLEMIALAFTHGTSDFPLLLSNIAQKSMLKGYDEQPETFEIWTNEGSLPDFKLARSVDMGSIGSLRQVPAGRDYKYVTFGERGEVYSLLTYGELFGIDRQTIINDDLGAFAAIPRKLGRAARRTVGDLAYAQLTANPVMADGVALFHASHGNLQAASGITTPSVDAMRTAMALQKDIGQTSGALNLELATLIVPKALDGAASVVRDSEFEVGTANKNNTVPNSQRSRFNVVSDARLDAASSSIWYAAANKNVADTVTLFYLDGNKTPFLDTKDGWGRDGAEYKVRIDVAAKAMDHRGMQRNG